jgi:hypothetical protein
MNNSLQNNHSGISLERTIEEYGKWAIHRKAPEPLRLDRLHGNRMISKGEEFHG